MSAVASADTESTDLPLLAVVAISVAGKKPTSDVPEDDQDDAPLGAVLARSVVDTAQARGWRAVVISTEGSDSATTRQAVAQADAVVLLGGADIDPAYYGGPATYPRQDQHFPTSDIAQIAVVGDAIKRAQPLLAICRGLQVVNVALGGTLIQDLGESVGDHRGSGKGIQDLFIAHKVRLQEGSAAQAVLGTDIDVLSAHHQVVDVLGAGLVVTAHAPDGVVEAIEHETAPVLAVQWHPENPLSEPSQLPALLDWLRSQLPGVNSSKGTTVTTTTTVQDIAADLKAQGVRAVEIGWLDNNAVLRARLFPLTELESVARRGIGVTPLVAVFNTYDAIIGEY
ncbi:MAG: gamma-glutamyl-gamma-aminobutyrate hydrolase family protein, partial [Gordonia sp. (in: high G+C Gram-positive bacteria)]